MHKASFKGIYKGSIKGLGFGSFRKLGVPCLGGPYNKEPTIWGAILGSPIFGNSQILGKEWEPKPIKQIPHRPCCVPVQDLKTPYNSLNTVTS